ncbi:uncharacterized protein LOC128202040 [Galleria mellonella]|uniref:Uncharacterized protein LOC128202040 n=1 Tax=Galleria mellonella TaxID=7137 RepID=A0ABM3MZV8_GALME|nr:uncharacterized protein LOC128202040 [Galleria mellonella]
MIKKSISFRLGLINIRSLNTGQDELVAAVNNYRLDVLAINETWLKNDQTGLAPAIPGYVFKHKARKTGSRGGGVGFYYKKGLRIRVLPHPTSDLEQMWVELHLPGTARLAIGTAYRPESVSVDTAIENLSSSLDTFSSYDSIYILTDFNVNINNKGASSTSALTTFLFQRNLYQLVNEPTRVTDNTSSQIDLVITDTPAICSGIYVYHNPKLSDHAMVVAELKMNKPQRSPQYIYKRILGNIDMNSFNNDLISLDWESVNKMTTLDARVNRFNELINTLFDVHAPMRKICINSNKPHPWITDNIKIMMRLRDSALRRARASGEDSHFDYYKSLRNYTSGALEREKKAYFTFYINNNKNKPKQMWHHLKQICTTNNVDQSLIPDHLMNPC